MSRKLLALWLVGWTLACGSGDSGPQPGDQVVRTAPPEADAPKPEKAAPPADAGGVYGTPELMLQGWTDTRIFDKTGSEQCSNSIPCCDCPC